MPEITLTEEALLHLKTDKVQEEFYDSSYEQEGSFGVRVARTGSKVFFLIYRLHAKRKRITLGRYPTLSLGAARTKALQIVASAESGEDPAALGRRYRDSSSVSALAQLFLSEHVEANCKASTRNEYARMISREILPFWGDMKVVDIQTHHIQALIEHVARERNSPSMANRLRSLISSLFSFAQSRHLAQHNPALSIASQLERPAPERILTMDELFQLWQLFPSEDPIISGIFKTILFTGQKPGDVMKMRWKDIILDTWHIRSAKTPKPFSPKVYLSQYMQQLLREIQDVQRTGEFVFSGSTGGHITYIRKAAKRLNTKMDTKDSWSPMDLRRTVEFHLSRLGVERKVVDFMMNRSSRFNQSDTTIYQPRAKSALLHWSRELALATSSKKPIQGDPKIVPLFSN